jgi:peptide/nickel transport system substrate-binding protein
VHVPSHTPLIGRFRGTRAAAAVAALLVLMTTVACSSSSSSKTDAAVKPDTLNVGLPVSSIPQDFNAAKTVPTTFFFAMTYEPLIHLNDDGTFGPALAKSFGYVGSGNTKFQLELRDDAKFADGTSVTADAVKKWLTYYSKNGAFATQFDLASIDTEGTNKVVLNFKTPKPDVPWNLAQTNGWGFVASPAAVDSPEQLSKATFGAGPYKYDPAQSQPGSQLTLVPNEYYYDKSKVRFKKVVLKQVGNASSMVQALSAGQIDIGQGDFSVLDAANKAGFANAGGTLSWDALRFANSPGSPWGKLEVRQAVNYAVDRKGLTKALIGGQGDATSTWMPADGFVKEEQEHYTHDPEKAKQLLQQAGYANGVTLTIVDIPGVLTDGTPADALVQAVAEQLKKIGVTLKITTVQPAQYFTELRSGKYDGYVANFGINTYGTYVPIFITSPAAGTGTTGDAKLKQLTSQYLSASDPAAVAQEVSRYVTEQALYLPIYAPKSYMFFKKGLKGVAFPTLPNGLVYGAQPDPTEWHF